MTTHHASLMRRPFVSGPSGRRSLLIATVTTLITASLGIAPAYASDDYAPAGDLYSMARVAQRAGAEKWWNAGYTGKGIDVAVIDTGVSPVQGIDGAGKVIYGPDLSLESQTATSATSTPTATARSWPGSSPATTRASGRLLDAGRRTAASPPAPASCLKVAVADGGADVSQVIAAIDWVIQHRTRQRA